jgi:hypothetical protein
MPEETDNYYQEQSLKAIEKAIAATEGKALEDVRFEIHQSYPFGPLRFGRAYKIWNKLVLSTEANLGLQPRKHKAKPPSPREECCREIIIQTLRDNAGKSKEEINYLLRKACPFSKKSAEYKVWIRVLEEIRGD